jgi:o-succinylbenzoate---CoA ligase
MKKQEQAFYFEGKAFSKGAIKEFCKNQISEHQTEEWKKECFSFILEWLSPSLTLKVHTSGSTGKPKEILLEKRFMIASAQATIDFFKLKPGSIAILCLPVRYIAGKMMIVRALVGSLDLYLTKPGSVPEIGKFQKIDFCAMVPNQVASLLETKNGAELLEQIQNLIIGGSVLPTNLESKIKKLKNNTWQTYGMTETITHIALRKLNGKNAEDFYSPLKGVRTSLDESGCLMITAEKIGIKRLVTHDLAEINNEGKFKILGRIDNIIISGGLKLVPEEIENKLNGCFENDYYISSIPDEKLGNKLVLYIEDEGKLKKQIYHLWEKIEERVSGFEIPKEIIFVQQFARTKTGKIIRK